MLKNSIDYIIKLSLKFWSLLRYLNQLFIFIPDGMVAFFIKKDNFGIYTKAVKLHCLGSKSIPLVTQMKIVCL